MPIQGIVSGFASQSDLTKHVILLGRGDHYDLVIDGAVAKPMEVSLDAAMADFATASVGTPDGWLDVRETRTCGATGLLRVTSVGRMRFADYRASQCA